MRGDTCWVPIAIVGAAMAIAAAGSFAIDGDSNQVIKGRIYNFRVIATSYKQINEELEVAAPNLEKIEEAARELVVTGKNMTDWFPPGSEPPAPKPKSWLEKWLPWFAREPEPDGFGIALEEKTYAKLEIWKYPDEFEQQVSLFHEKAQRMQTVAEGGDIRSIRNQAQALGASCDGCHEVFREELD